MGRQPVWIAQHSDLVAGVVVLLGFCWRIWLAQATFFNTDEAWHYSLANQDSLRAAYRASRTISHPPLLVLLLYFWKKLGTSDLTLRMPAVIAGAGLCWVFFKWTTKLFGRAAGWAGLILMTFLPPMIALSAELRQYTLMMLFCVWSGYLLEMALERDSAGLMFASCLCLYVGLLSHYSAFLFAAALGIYCLVRIALDRPRPAVVSTWALGQALGIGLGVVLWKTQVSKLGSVYAGAQPLHRYADWYLPDWYFHPGRDQLAKFLWKGTFGIFRFIFGQTAVGQISAVLFGAALILLVSGGRENSRRRRLYALLLLVPFLLSWVAVGVGLYPYGRTRQCIFLAIFGIAGVGMCFSRMMRERTAAASALAIAVVVVCQLFGTVQGRDMLPPSEQRRQHMADAVDFLRSHVAASDAILTDKATSFQLQAYLCDRKTPYVERPLGEFESFECGELQVVSTGANDGALLADTVAAKAMELVRIDTSHPGKVWVAQGGWARGLGAALRESPTFSELEIHLFGRYFEIFELPAQAAARDQR